MTHERLAELRERVSAPNTRELAFLIIELGDILLTALDDLNASVANLQAQVGAENTEVASLADSLTKVSAQLADLQAQVTGGGTVTADQLEAVAAQVKTVADSAAAAVASATAPPAPAGGGGAPATERSLYTFDGDPTTVDAAQWPASGFETTDTPPKPLYFFSGDTAPGDKNGDGADNGQWHLYTGPTQTAGGAAPADIPAI